MRWPLFSDLCNEDSIPTSLDSWENTICIYLAICKALMLVDVTDSIGGYLTQGSQRFLWRDGFMLSCEWQTSIRQVTISRKSILKERAQLVQRPWRTRGRNRVGLFREANGQVAGAWWGGGWGADPVIPGWFTMRSTKWHFATLQ